MWLVWLSRCASWTFEMIQKDNVSISVFWNDTKKQHDIWQFICTLIDLWTIGSFILISAQVNQFIQNIFPILLIKAPIFTRIIKYLHLVVICAFPSLTGVYRSYNNTTTQQHWKLCAFLDNRNSFMVPSSTNL